MSCICSIHSKIILPNVKGRPFEFLIAGSVGFKPRTEEYGDSTCYYAPNVQHAVE